MISYCKQSIDEPNIKVKDVLSSIFLNTRLHS